MAVQVQVRERVGFHRDVYNSLIKTLIRQRKTGEFCDVVLRVNRKTYAGHRAILAASSPYFRSMFSSGMKETLTNREVDLSKSLQLDHDDSFKQVLDFMYSGDIEINVDNSEDILRIADFLLFEDVKEYCRQFYLSHGNLNLSNCLWISVLAEHHSLAEVAEVAKLTVKSRFHDYFVHSDELLDLPEFVFMSLLSDSEVVQFTSPENLALGISRWARQNATDGNRCLHRLVSCLSPCFVEQCARLVVQYILPPQCSDVGALYQSQEITTTTSTRSKVIWDDIHDSEYSKLDNEVVMFDDETVSEDALVALNCNTAMKFFQLYIYRVAQRRWYAMPVDRSIVLRMIPARLNVCAITLHRSTLYMFLSFNLPYPTDLQRLHVMAFDIELGRLALLTFNLRQNAVHVVCQTTLTDDRSVPPAMVYCAGFICLVGNVDGTGHLFVCDLTTLTYDCHRVPGTRFVSLARLAVRNDVEVVIWCRHRFGHEEYCVNREVSFAVFNVVERTFNAVEFPPPPSVGYQEFAGAHALCVKADRVLVHTPGKCSVALNETHRAWDAQSTGLPALPRYPSPLDAPYRGYTLTTQSTNSGVFFFSNPLPFLTALTCLDVEQSLPLAHTPPPIDGVSLCTAGLLRSSVFSALPPCERFDESYAQMIHKKTKQLYDTDTEESAGGRTPDDGSGGREEEDYDGFEYDDDIYGYFDDYEYENNINEL